jgi:hypothetical protein
VLEAPINNGNADIPSRPIVPTFTAVHHSGNHRQHTIERKVDLVDVLFGLVDLLAQRELNENATLEHRIERRIRQRDQQRVLPHMGKRERRGSAVRFRQKAALTASSGGRRGRMTPSYHIPAGFPAPPQGA